jgi:hypothetical protein
MMGCDTLRMIYMDGDSGNMCKDILWRFRQW